MIINLVEQSVLGSLGKVELLAEFFDDILWELTLINLDVLDILAAIKLYLKLGYSIVTEDREARVLEGDMLFGRSRRVTKLRLEKVLSDAAADATSASRTAAPRMLLGLRSMEDSGRRSLCSSPERRMKVQASVETMAEMCNMLQHET